MDNLRYTYIGRAGRYGFGNPHRARISQFELFEREFLDSMCSSLPSY